LVLRLSPPNERSFVAPMSIKRVSSGKYDAQTEGKWGSLLRALRESTRAESCSTGERSCGGVGDAEDEDDEDEDEDDESESS